MLLQLGTFKFSIDTAAYSKLEKSYAWNWAEQSRIRHTPAMDFTGKTADTEKLSGIQYPHYRSPLVNGQSALKPLRDLADKGEPLQMTSGSGVNLGSWVVLDLSETQSELIDTGEPRKIEFNITLKRYTT